MRFTALFVAVVGILCIEGFSLKRDDQQGGLDPDVREGLININTELTRDEFGDDVADIVHDVLSDCLNKPGKERMCLVKRAKEFCELAQWSEDSQECKDLVADFNGAGELGEDIHGKCSEEVKQGVEEALECAGPIAKAHCDEHRDPEECHKFMGKFADKARELYSDDKKSVDQGMDQDTRDALISIGTELARDEFGDDVAGMVHTVLSDCLNQPGKERKCLVKRAFEFCDLAGLTKDDQECKDLVADFDSAGELGEDIHEECSDKLALGVDEAFECAGPIAEEHCDQHRDPEECHKCIGKFEDKARELYTSKRTISKINRLRAFLKLRRLQKVLKK